jgi:hypothetical protein
MTNSVAAYPSFSLQNLLKYQDEASASNPCIISSEGGLSPMSSLIDQWYDGVASNHKPPRRKSPAPKGNVVPAWKEKALACALRKKAALFCDANCAAVLEVVRWAITANHSRMDRYGEVQLRRALWEFFLVHVGNVLQNQSNNKKEKNPVLRPPRSSCVFCAPLHGEFKNTKKKKLDGPQKISKKSTHVTHPPTWAFFCFPAPLVRRLR